MASHAYSTTAPEWCQRRKLEAAIEYAIELLDRLDGDADAEDDGSAEMAEQHEIRGGALVRAA